jgi:hypothetical protein
VAPGPVWTGAENLAPTGIRSPDRPARSQSLYRLSYPAHTSCEFPKRMKLCFIYDLCKDAVIFSQNVNLNVMLVKGQ